MPREDDLMLFRVGCREKIRVTTADPLEGPTVPLGLTEDDDEAGRIEIIDQANLALNDVSFGEDGGGKVRKIRAGVYEYDFGSDQPGVWASLYRFRVGKGDAERVVRKQHLIRCTSHRYLFLIPRLRAMIDKSRKRVSTVLRTGRELRFGYTDAMLSVYLDLGVGLINTVPPITGFQVETFPNDPASESLLIYAGLIVGLESQGVYSIDTDVNYNFGGNSLTVDHLSKVAQFLGLPFLANYKELLVGWKQQFRAGGIALVQMQYSYSLGRLFTAVPSGWFTRFGLGMGPTSYQPMI